MHRILTGFLVFLLLTAVIGRDYAAAIGRKEPMKERVPVTAASMFDNRMAEPWGAPRPASSANILAAIDLSGEMMNARVLGDPELRCLAEAIYFEARSETLQGQLAVAQVILNRVENPEFPKSICGVVYQPGKSSRRCQFSFACDGLPEQPLNMAAWRRAQEIGLAAREGMLDDLTHRALYYHRTTVTPGWRMALTQTRTLGDHVFYRYSGR